MRLLSCTFLLFILSYTHHAQVIDYKKEAALLIKALQKNHYQPRIIDDSLSQDIFFRFLELTDSDGMLLTMPAYSSLLSFRYSLDDELKKNEWKFIPFYLPVYKEQLLQAEKIITSFLESPITLQGKEVLDLSESDTVNLAKNDKVLEKRWQQWLKYRVMKQIVLLHGEKNLDQVQVSKLLQLEPEARKKVKIRELKKIRKILDHPSGFENYISNIYLYAISTCFDPHSNYMSRTTWENFEAELSAESLSFGIDLVEDEAGNVIIAALVPGGPAWNSGELHKGDMLMEARWENKSVVDISDYEIREIEALFRASNNDKLELTVRKADGIIKKVLLKKARLENDENIVKSFILSGQKKIGYISLPGFYSSMEDYTGNGCANDVAKEILKLKKENIEGLIIDIRYNSGGSLLEGIGLAGIFIDEGPLVMLKGREKINVLKDLHRGTVYDGPLVLMVNGQSASASEVLAATLQDYNRAVIVGSNTFGKATGQIILPLDTTVSIQAARKNKTISNSGYLKVTITKIYRVTGKIAQMNGVNPDVKLPDIFENSEFFESLLPYALTGDSVNKKVVYSALKKLPVNQVSSLSNNRVKKDEKFMNIKKLVDEDYFNSYGDKIPLDIGEFLKLYKEINRKYEVLSASLSKEHSNFKVENNSSDLEILKVNSYLEKLNNDTVKNLQKDLYLEEVYQVISDIINITKN
ncbi:MAG: carboxy terminal-processing peptidase [Cytophagaceae bacterium]